jgi:peptidoglycan/LPS O-acetylase OafA/YrhL
VKPASQKQLTVVRQFSDLGKTVPRRIAELDGIRAIAVMWVLMYHFIAVSFESSTWTGVGAFAKLISRPGWMGVHLFFILSGFLITGILLDSKNSPGYFRNFYGKRVLRILPAYFFTIGLVALFYPTKAYWLLSALFLSNFAPNFGVAMDYPPFWTLAVEEHFYLAWPLLVHFTSRKQLTTLCIVGLFAGPILRAAYFLNEVPMAYETWFSTESLCYGALAALAVRSWDRAQLTNLALSALGLAALIGCISAPFGIHTRTTFVGAVYQLPMIDLAATAFVLTVLNNQGKASMAWLRQPWMQFVGLISFSLYLTHPLVGHSWNLLQPSFIDGIPLEPGSLSFALLRLVIVGAFSILVAYASYRFVELPALKLKDRLFSAKANATPKLRIAK